VNIRFILGPAGSGKTHACLGEIRSLLAGSPHGLPLILLAPKQATFQLERQLLGDGDLKGYARLQILSFERLADFVLKALSRSTPRQLSDEGRLMGLRSLLAQKHQELEIFRSSARLPGFAQELLKIIGEFQRCRHGPSHLRQFAQRMEGNGRLAMKLRDVALLMEAYRSWLQSRELGDGDALMEAAADALTAHFEHGVPASAGQPTDSAEPAASSKSSVLGVPALAGQPPDGAEPAASSTVPPAKAGTPNSTPPLYIEALWMDGFAELTPQELHFLTALAPFCGHMSLAFCLDDAGRLDESWMSTWSLTSRCFRLCLAKMAAIPELRIETKILQRNPLQSRFAASPALAYLEKHWSLDSPDEGEHASGYPADAADARNTVEMGAVRLVSCSKPDLEVVFAAREILRHVRQGGRYRECAVLLRQFDAYHNGLRRIFNRYGIPFFLDRREAISHHPLAELTRYMLRTIALGWPHDDWFGALKTGLMPEDDDALDGLENAALASGWDGEFWRHPILPSDSKIDPDWMQLFHRKIVLPVLVFEKDLIAGNPAGLPAPSGRQLALALRNLWKNLAIDQRLKEWAGVAHEQGPSGVIHATVWQQMHHWLDNLELAFPDACLSLDEWLPILESGLAGMTVGVIPPSLDQVLIGVVDRSRNPDLKTVLVLGMNESIFPALPSSGGILSPDDRDILSREGMELGPDFRLQLGREKYLAYIACTRAREKLVLSWSESGADDRALHVSPYVNLVRTLFPRAPIERFDGVSGWNEPLHPEEYLAPLLAFYGRNGAAPQGATDCLAPFPLLHRATRQLSGFPAFGSLSAATAECLYGRRLGVSVSALESFASCPFQFFVGTALRGRDRDVLELDDFEKGSFMHEALAQFHRCVRASGRRWRDLSPGEARVLAEKVVTDETVVFRSGLFTNNRVDALTAESLGRSVLDYVEIAVQWMVHYGFDPAEVELPFGMGQEGLPAWELQLEDGHSLALRGKMDRVDVWISPEKDRALCVVVDYKSSKRQLDRALLEAGVQLQLPVYLNVLRHLENPAAVFGVPRLEPAGVFYVNLRGDFAPGKNRGEVLSQLEETRSLAYRHKGRFDADYLDKFDSRSGGLKSLQFSYTINKDGSLAKRNSDAMTSVDFNTFLDGVGHKITEFGQAIYAGSAAVAPYKKGTVTACDHCRFAAICRIDPWTHEYRMLR
jgi:ATP-dependent helicase/nuclease subunit B